MVTKMQICLVGLLVLLFAMSSLAGCGGGSDEPDENGSTSRPPVEKIKITIGNLTDITGPASNAMEEHNDRAVFDLVKYYNEGNLIPGVEIELINYDTVTNPSRFIPGYEWVREKGADIIFTPTSPPAEVVKPLADADGVPLFSSSMTTLQLDPPGWTFGRQQLNNVMMYTLLDWIAENDWDYETNGPAKIGTANWAAQTSEDFGNAMKEYAEAFPNRFQYVGSFFTALGTPNWGNEIEQLKDCDYIFPPHVGFSAPAFIREYRNAGYNAKFIGYEAHISFLDMMIEGAGWDAFDGMLVIMSTRGWNEEAPEIELAKELLEKYHGASELEEAMKYGGQKYIGPFEGWYGVFELIKEAVERVGVENYSNQALYDTAIQFSTQVGGNGWSWTETKRTNWEGLGIYALDAAKEEVIRIVPEWQPVVTDLTQ